MTNGEIVKLLEMLLAFFIILLVISIFAFLINILIKKHKKKDKKPQEQEEKQVNTKEKTYKTYTKESIYKFMQFDKIEDNMIIQKDGKRFLMVVECQGVNYDLMSRMEKVAVEEGFLQFLNSLKHPIQIYVQSRTIKLKNSINTYKEKLDKYKRKLDRMNNEFARLKEQGNVNLSKYHYEIVKQRNLYEYGKDIIANTEKMDLNKNILTKKYYVIVPYYSEEANNLNLGKEEIKNLAFSELYTRAQAIMRTLFACEVNCKILNSVELIELLYVAYNRDESEIYDIEKVINSGCEDIYSTAEDVFEKKIKALDELIEKEAQKEAQEAFDKAKSIKQEIADRKAKNAKKEIKEIAKMILEENKDYIGEEMVDEAKKILDGKEGVAKK